MVELYLIYLFLYFLLNKAVSKLIGECKSTGKCQNDLATVLHLTLVPIMMKTYITIATFHIAIRLCSYCCMSRVIGQHNIQVEILFPWKKIFTCTIFSFLIFRWIENPLIFSSGSGANDPPIYRMRNGLPDFFNWNPF